MRNSRLSHDDVTALLDGAAPLGRPDLEQLAMIVDDLRLGSLESPPRPSAALAALLDGTSAISPVAGGLRPESDRGAVLASLAPVPHRGRTRMALSWFAGFGLAAKIGIGATAVALGATGAGAAHALPPAIQTGFDGIIAAVAPESGGPVVDDGSDVGPGDEVVDGTTEGATDDGATGDVSTDDATTGDGAVAVPADGTVGDDKTAHAQAVTEAAHDKTTQGREHGEAVSDAAHQNKGRDEPSDDPAELEDESNDTGSDDSGSDANGSGNSGSGTNGSGNSKHDK